MQPFDYNCHKFQQDCENELSFRRNLLGKLNYVIEREVYDNFYYLLNRNEFHNIAVKKELSGLDLSEFDVVDVGGQVGQLSLYLPEARSYQVIERYHYPKLMDHFKEKINAQIIHDDFCAHIFNHPEQFYSKKHLFIFSMVLNEFSSTGISYVLSEIKKLNPGNKILIIESEKTAWKIRENRQTQLFTKEEESTGVIDLRDSRPLQEINGHFLQRRFRYVAFKFNFGGTIWNF